jgi:hypothetical protein
MFYYTNNSVEFEGRKFIQIKKKLDSGNFMFGGYIEMGAIIRGEVWIGKNSYIFKDCALDGNIRVRENSIIKNSILTGRMVIGSNCTIDSCHIRAVTQYITVIDNNCNIYKQYFKSTGKYEPYYFKDGNIETDTYNNNVLTMTNNYCKINCLFLTYEKAWEYLNNEEKWEYMQNKYLDVPQVFYKDTKKWLYYWCEKQLKRKEGRAK